MVGDITILSNRAKYVDFTLPYTESGIVMVVKNNQSIDVDFLKALELGSLADNSPGLHFYWSCSQSLGASNEQQQCGIFDTTWAATWLVLLVSYCSSCLS